MGGGSGAAVRASGRSGPLTRRPGRRFPCGTPGGALHRVRRGRAEWPRLDAAARRPTVPPLTRPRASGGTRPVSSAPKPAAATTASAGPVIPLRATGSTSAAAGCPTTAALTPASAARAPGRARRACQNGMAPITSSAPGRKIATVAMTAPGCAGDRSGGGRPEERREREERSGQRLCRAVSGEEHVLAHPARRHDARLEERQDDVAAAEDERPGPVERLDERDARVAGRDPGKGQADSSPAKIARATTATRRETAGTPGSTTAYPRRRPPCRAAAGRRARLRADDDQGQLCEGCCHEQRDGRCREGERRPRQVGREGPGHRPDRVGDDRNGGDLEAVDPAPPGRTPPATPRPRVPMIRAEAG